MSIESDRIVLFKRLKKESRQNLKGFCRKARLPYQTIICILNGRSIGSMRTWLKIEKHFTRKDAKETPELS
jgi:predicted transcriptional regulator